MYLQAFCAVDGTDICHHGTKGQRWGIRKYQNRDGSLTPLGRQRYSGKSGRRQEIVIDKRDLKRLAAKRQDDKTAAKPTNDKHIRSENSRYNKRQDDRIENLIIPKKNLADYTDAELKRMTERLNIEKNYMDAVNAANPKVQTRTQKIMDKALDALGTKFVDTISSHGEQVMKYIVGEAINQLVGKKIIGNQGNQGDKNKDADQYRRLVDELVKKIPSADSPKPQNSDPKKDKK